MSIREATEQERIRNSLNLIYTLSQALNTAMAIEDCVQAQQFMLSCAENICVESMDLFDAVRRMSSEPCQNEETPDRPSG